jgi:RND family efflux transporter MFP subunit
MTQKIKMLGASVVAIIVIAGVWIWIGRSRAETSAEDNSAADSFVPVAPVAHVERGPVNETLVLSGAFKPFQDVDVHAKVAGYIQKIFVDVGDHVRQGQTIAVLEVPELAAQLAGADAGVRRAREEIKRAQGDLQRAKSSHAAAHAMNDRLKQAAQQKAGLVAQQDLDDAQAKDLEQEAQVSSAEAALSSAEQQLQVAQATQKQYNALSDYTRITAPFAGVITTRYADTGALISAGTSTSTQSMPVVRLAQVSTLRLVLLIPESMASSIHLKDPVNVRVQALNQSYVGTVCRFADSLDPQTRTMETEIDFENKDGKLIPGMFVEARLAEFQHKDALKIPVEAVSRVGDLTKVLLVNSQNTVEERTVKLGKEGSVHAEVLAGLNEGDRVIVGNLGNFRAGQKVTPKDIEQTPPAGGK